jgi:hypothetical protein
MGEVGMFARSQGEKELLKEDKRRKCKNIMKYRYPSKNNN